MRDREPFVCDVCGADVSGSNPMFVAEFGEFGISDVRGRFCSMEHAIEWAASPPPLVPRKHQFNPGAPGTTQKGFAVVAILVLVLVSIVVGLITIARFVVDLM